MRNKWKKIYIYIFVNSILQIVYTKSLQFQLHSKYLLYFNYGEIMIKILTYN